MNATRLTLEEVAQRLRTSKRVAVGLIRSGAIRGLAVGRPGSLRPRYVVDESDLKTYEELVATRPAPEPLRRQRRTEPTVPNYFA